MSVENTGDSVNQTSETVDASQTTQQAQPNLGAIRKAGQAEVLKALGTDFGQDFGSIKDAAEFFKSIKASVGSEQPKQAAPKQSNSETAELRQMIQSLTAQVAEKDNAVKRTNFLSTVKDTAINVGFDKTMLDIATPLFEQQVAFDDKGNYYVKGKDGNMRYDNNGEPYSLDALAKEILTARPKLAAEEMRTGTGTKFGFNANNRDPNVVPDRAADPEGWKAWKQQNGLISGGGTANFTATVAQRKF